MSRCRLLFVWLWTIRNITQTYWVCGWTVSIRPPLTQRRVPTPLFSSTGPIQKEQEEQEQQQQSLSEVDARVLQDMLSEKVNLDSEEEIKKLLERGTVKTVERPPQQQEEDGAYSSKILNTLASTKLWQKVTSQGKEVLESVGIWVQNKVENDVKILAALGLFAWERVQQDVARALPATSSSSSNNNNNKQKLLLGNSTAYQALNRPSDELQAVSQQVSSILSGAKTATPRRGLTTAAPAGIKNTAERQRRAYQSSRDKKKQTTQKTVGTVVNTAWELQSELQAERNAPGYKTQRVRQAIAASVSATSNILRAGASSTGRLESSSSKVVSEDGSKQEKEEAFPEQRLELVLAKLTEFVEDPSSTWLTEDVIAQLDDLDVIASMQSVITEILVLRDEMSVTRDVSSHFTDEFETICHAADRDVSSAIAKALRRQMASVLEEAPVPRVDQETTVNVNGVGNGNVSPEWEAYYASTNAGTVPSTGSTDADVVNGGDSFFATTTATITTSEASVSVAADEPQTNTDRTIVEEATVVREPAVEAHVIETRQESTVVPDKERSSTAIGVELITDDDFHQAVGDVKAATNVAALDEEHAEEPNALVVATLRSLDVVFFVAEKAVTVGVPRTVELAETAVSRIQEAHRDGKGSPGWQTFQNLADAKGRY